MCVSYNDESYLKRDTSVKCYSREHALMILSFAFVFIVMWAIIYPIFVDLRLSKIKENLNYTNNLKLYGVFYIGMNDSSYYWEVRVVNLRKISLILCAAFLTRMSQAVRVSLLLSLTSQGILGILILFIQRQFSHFKDPFLDPRFN